MRRKRPASLEVPEHLLHLRPEDWAIDQEQAQSLWLAARREWLYANRDGVDGVWFIAQGYDERRKVLYDIDPPPRHPRLR